MDEPRTQKFLIVESDAKYAAWLQHAIGVGWPGDSIVIMDWSSFARVRTAMTARDYDIVMLALKFDESYEEPTTDGLEWIRKLRTQAGFPEMIVLAEGGSELTAVRSLRLGAADYLPKRLLTPARLTRSIKLTLRGIEKQAQRAAALGATKTTRDQAAPTPHTATHTGAGSALARAAQAALQDHPARPHTATHTGAGSGLARAAQAALADGPVRPHTATHTGAGSGLARAAQAALGEAPAKPHTSTHTGTASGLARAAQAALQDDAAKAHVSTHTGASLAQAAQAALKEQGAQSSATPDSGPAKPHISTHTGAGLAKAAQAAVESAPPRAHISTHTGASIASAAQAAMGGRSMDLDAGGDPLAPSLPGTRMLSRAQPEAPRPQAKESKQMAPESHQIPGYTLLQKIGESEAAAVYLAISEDLGHNVALKISKRKHSGDPNDTGQRAIMFQREFEAIAALDHPSIIDLFDYGIHEGVEYLAMEYFPCGDLKARLQNPLTADEAIAFLKEIARSLKVVHDAGLIHRDLKPPNVMLRDDGSVVLIDFGLARSLLTGDGSTRTGVLRGSPYYMSPEQAQGEALDARTDLYSLGVILYEMLAGRKPYLGASAIDVLQQHVMAPVPELPVHHLCYQPLLERLMSKSREHRIASCDELLAAIDEMTHALGDRGTSDPRSLVAAGAES